MEKKPGSQDVIAEFRKRLHRQLIAIVPAVLALLLIPLAAATEESAGGGFPVAIAGPLAIVVVLGVLVFSIFNWRCPACNAYLGKSGIPTFCKKCGARLRG
jgi:Na+/citrate or Na+/malate symporter